MIFSLIQDLTDALAAMPQEQPRRHALTLLDEAIRRDTHFIDRHPTTLFQCLWNTCWWYDCTEAAEHYEIPEGGWNAPPPWAVAGVKLSSLLEFWKQAKEENLPGFRWLRSMRPLPMPLDGRLRCTLRGHQNWVSDLAFAPDGRQLASASDDRTVRIWDVASGAELACLIGHTQNVRKVTYSADGRYLTSTGQPDWGGPTKQIEKALWDSANGWQLIETREVAKTEPQEMEKRWSPDGQLYAQQASGIISIVDTVSGAICYCEGHTNRVCSLTFSADNRLLASAVSGENLVNMSPDDCSVRIWDTKTGVERACLNGHRDRVSCLTFSADNRYLISASCDHTARVWDVVQGTLTACLSHPASVGSLAVSTDSHWLATVSGEDHTISIWDLGKAVRLGPERQLIAALHGQVVAASCDQQTIITYHGQGELCVREAQSGIVKHRLMSNPMSFRTSALSSDGRLLAFDGPDLSIQVWDIARGQRYRAFSPRSQSAGQAVDSDPNHPLSLMFFDENRKLLSVRMMEGVIRTWDIESGKALACVTNHSNVPRCGYDFAIAPDQRSIASLRMPSTESESKLGPIHLWDVTTGRVRRRLGTWLDGQSLSFSADGRLLATFSGVDGSICVFDVASGTEWARLPLPKEFVRERLALSSNGSRVACELSTRLLDGDSDRLYTTVICVWDVLNGTLLASTTGNVPLELFAEGGNVLLAASRGSETAIVTALNGETVATFLGAWVITPVQDRIWKSGLFQSLDYHYIVRLEGIDVDATMLKHDATLPPISPEQRTQPAPSHAFVSQMASPHELNVEPPPPATPTLAATDRSSNAEVTLLHQVKQQLADGHVAKAFELLKEQPNSSLYWANAQGVCLLRLGHLEDALEQFRSLTLNGIRVIPDAPIECKTNLATALLLTRNIEGCLQLLDDIRNDQHPTVQRLRQAIQQWKASFGFRDKLRWFLGSEIHRPIILDAPLGELLIPAEVR